MFFNMDNSSKIKKSQKILKKEYTEEKLEMLK